MLEARKITNQEPTPYATGADFCRIFQKDMNRFYLLSFLLTGDHSMAERGFVRGLDDSSKGNPVFKKWAESWARRTIIQNAIQMVRPRPTDGSTSSPGSDRSASHATSDPTVPPPTIAIRSPMCGRASHMTLIAVSRFAARMARWGGTSLGMTWTDPAGTRYVVWCG